MYVPPNIKAILAHFDRVRGGNKKMTWHQKVVIDNNTLCFVMKAVNSTTCFCYDFSFDKSHKDHIETILSLYPLDVGSDPHSLIYVLDDQANHRYDVTHLLNLHNIFNLQYWIDVLGLMESRHNVSHNP